MQAGILKNNKGGCNSAKVVNLVSGNEYRPACFWSLAAVQHDAFLLRLTDRTSRFRRHPGPIGFDNPSASASPSSPLPATFHRYGLPQGNMRHSPRGSRHLK